MFNKSVEKRMLEKFGIHHVITAKALLRMLNCAEINGQNKKLMQREVMFIA